MQTSRIGLTFTAVVALACAKATQAPAPAPTTPASGAAAAQTTAPLPIPEVGANAPNFTFRPVTKDGIANRTRRLSDYRGQTVVLWFFVRARTRG